MNKSHEEELLKSLFRKLKLEEAPEDLTIKVMDQIMVSPAAEPYLNLYKVLLWTGIGLLSVLSMHITGVFYSLERLFIPYIFASYNLFTEYAETLSVLLPSNTFIFPSSVLQVFLPGVFLLILIDILFDMDVQT